MFLVFALIVIFLFMAAVGIAAGLLMLLAAAFVAFLVVTLILAGLAAWRGPED